MLCRVADRAFGTLLLGVAVAGPLAAADASVRCALEAREAGGALLLTALAAADVSGEGDFALTVRQHGPAGSANVTQAGGAEFTAGATTTLATLSLAAQPSALDVRLTVSLGGSEMVCTFGEGDLAPSPRL